MLSHGQWSFNLKQEDYSFPYSEHAHRDRNHTGIYDVRTSWRSWMGHSFSKIEIIDNGLDCPGTGTNFDACVPKITLLQLALV